MQYSILKFFQQISNPFLDKVVEFITLFGETLPIISIILLVYWCINKKEGIALCSTLLSSLVFTNLVKPIFHIERPFVQHPDIVGKRVATATGFSFPSGHTTTGATFYPTLAQGEKSNKKWLFASIIFAVLIGLSRLYLGVHWPLDVIGGLIIGLLSSFLLYPMFLRTYNSKHYSSVVLIFSIVAFLLAFPLAITLTFKPEFDTYFSDLMKTSILAFGALFGLYFERKYINFSTGGTLGKKAIRFFVGIIGLGLISLLKFIFPQSLYYIGAIIRYGLIGIWATCIYPLIAIKIGIMSRENQ